MDVKIEAESMEIIGSGTVIAFAQEPIKISIGPPADRLNIIIVFKTTGAIPIPGLPGSRKTDVKVLDPNTLQITITDLNAPSGYGTPKPIKIGTIESKEVYLQYRIYDLGGASDKMLHYTFYRSKE